MLGEEKIIMKASMKLFLIASILLFTFNSICYAKKSLNDMTMWERLVGKKKVFAIATAPGIPKGKTPYFTSKSLEKKLPSLYPAHISIKWCDGKWKQRGAIVLDNKDVIFWHSCENNLIIFEGKKYFGSYTFQ